jgi:hypothetical protein
MKITRTKVFEPLVITLESAHEIDLFHGIIDYYYIAQNPARRVAEDRYPGNTNLFELAQAILKNLNDWV